MQPKFEEACEWATSSGADVVMLLGHWNQPGDGCEDAATVPEVYNELRSLPACASVASKLKYFEGHRHCNIIMEKDVGFMVGGQGMIDFMQSPCGGELGFPIVDTTNGRFKVYYFLISTIAARGGYDQYDAVLECFRTKGVSQCYHLATLWADATL
jgi:hypothetical protein